jgi:two-component system, NarL family, response regulator DesR
VIRILLVEQRFLYRDALAKVLSAEEDLEISASLAYVDEAVTVAGTLRPDIVVVDIDQFADRSAVLAGELSDALADCSILVLADPDSPGTLRAALDTHVRGFVDKNAAPSRLAQEIRRVHQGERVIDPTLAIAALRLPPNPLTERERDVLKAAAPGVPANEIANRLQLSVGTVRNYVSRIIRKTGARNRSEAVRIAQDRGWL